MSEEPKYLNRYNSEVEFSDLLGATLVAVTGAEKDSTDITFTADDGRVWVMNHQPDCCEVVSIEDVIGNVDDLLGTPITMAECVESKDENPDGVPVPEYQDSFTWTFYKLATVKGYVTLRWYGESNGYYSESVDIHRVNPPRRGFA